MRHIRFVLTCLAAFATVSCTEALEEIATGADGEITVSLTSDWDCRPHLKSAVQEEEVPAEDILSRSNTGCEFIMIRDFAEGEYKIRIETYDGGSPLVLEYGKIIKLV